MAGTPCIETVERAFGSGQVLAEAGVVMIGNGVPVTNGSLLTSR